MTQERKVRPERIDQSRLKSPVLWISVFFQVVTILGILGLLEQWGITSDNVEKIIAACSQIVVLFGVTNDPTTKNRF